LLETIFILSLVYQIKNQTKNQIKCKSQKQAN